MLKTVKFRLLFAFLLLVFSIICIDILLTPPVDNTNINVLNLHMKAISGNRPSRGSLNYDLYVLENNEHYKIGADWADCFYYNDFISNVKPGQLIRLSIRKYNGFLSSNLKLVVALVAGGRNYLDSNCVNKETSDEKIYIPIFGIVFLIIVYCLLHYQELKDSKTKGKKKPKMYQVN